MAYIGKGLDNGVRNQFIFAATQGQTAFSGADSDGKTLAISDILYTDCFQNGVKLEPTTDYTVTLTSLTLVNAASLNDVVDIVSFDIFAVPDTVPASTGGTFGGGITATTGTFSGDVAINGASATHPLSVNGQIKSTGANGETLQLQTSSQYSGISFIGSDGTRDAIIDYDHTNGALGLKAHTSSHYINFMTGGYSERFRITDNGVTFNGDTAAANALDDYEEGSIDPTITIGSGSISTDHHSVLTYTKIGNLVHVRGRIYLTFSTSDVTSFSVSLPFATASGDQNEAGTPMYVIRSTDASPSTGLHGGIRLFGVAGGTSTANMRLVNGAFTGNFGASNPHIFFNLTYVTS